MRKKLLLLTIKYLPIIHMVGFLLNNTLYCFDYIDDARYDIDFIFGDGILNIIAFIIISFGLYYCLWHRLIIIANGINLTIAWYDANCGLPVEGGTLLSIYYIVASIAIIIATYIHIKYDKHTD